MTKTQFQQDSGNKISLFRANSIISTSATAARQLLSILTEQQKSAGTFYCFFQIQPDAFTSQQHCWFFQSKCGKRGAITRPSALPLAEARYLTRHFKDTILKGGNRPAAHLLQLTDFLFFLTNKCSRKGGLSPSFDTRLIFPRRQQHEAEKNKHRCGCVPCDNWISASP